MTGFWGRFFGRFHKSDGVTALPGAPAADRSSPADLNTGGTAPSTQIRDDKTSASGSRSAEELVRGVLFGGEVLHSREDLEAILLVLTYAPLGTAAEFQDIRNLAAGGMDAIGGPEDRMKQMYALANVATIFEFLEGKSSEASLSPAARNVLGGFKMILSNPGLTVDMLNETQNFPGAAGAMAAILLALTGRPSHEQYSYGNIRDHLAAKGRLLGCESTYKAQENG